MRYYVYSDAEQGFVEAASLDEAAEMVARDLGDGWAVVRDPDTMESRELGEVQR
ncbi:MAG: hypothetical protein ABID40_00035 [Candidatus Bipolaricaulota bacterium]